MHSVVMVHGQISALVVAWQGCLAGAVGGGHLSRPALRPVSCRSDLAPLVCEGLSTLHCDAIRPRQFALPSERLHA